MEVARAVGHINDSLADQSFILLGPGRWGSQDIRLGVQVGFSGICNARALVEIALRSEGYTPEPSFGTHFFQELIEASILYLPLYPDDDSVIYNRKFLRESPNALPELRPEDDGMADIVRVIDVGKTFSGRQLHLVMDGELQEALCYLK